MPLEPSYVPEYRLYLFFPRGKYRRKKSGRTRSVPVNNFRKSPGSACFDFVRFILRAQFDGERVKAGRRDGRERDYDCLRPCLPVLSYDRLLSPISQPCKKPHSDRRDCPAPF